MRRLGSLLGSQARLHGLVALLCIGFLAWFSMKFYMDNSNDSETDAYVSAMLASIGHASIPADATGHYTALAPYVLWPFTTALRPLTGAFQIRGFVLARLLVGLLLHAAAYAWFRRLGLGWLASLVGLMLLSICLAFALLERGWELDKLIEPGLFLLAGLAAWNQRPVAVVVLAALAAANRETGIFLPLIALVGWSRDDPSLRRSLARWPVRACLVVGVVEVGILRWLGPPPNVAAWTDLTIDRLVYVIGGLCLLPLLATAWLRAAPLALQRLFVLLVPAWVGLILASDRLVQGAVLLTPLALLFVPITLMGVAQTLRAGGDLLPGAPPGDTRDPAAPAGR